MRAWAVSRATMSVPVIARRVLTGWSSGGSGFSWPMRSMVTGGAAGVPVGREVSRRVGSSCSTKMPSWVILPRLAVGRAGDADADGNAAWRGRRTTRASWEKYLPPNSAPMPSDGSP